MTTLSNLSREQLLDMVAKLQAKGERKISMKVTAKKADGSGTDGAVSLYGLGRFPITLYASQWERLIACIKAGEVDAFLTANASKLTRKDD